MQVLQQDFEHILSHNEASGGVNAGVKRVASFKDCYQAKGCPFKWDLPQ